jgi:hypothetical protein
MAKIFEKLIFGGLHEKHAVVKPYNHCWYGAENQVRQGT